MSKNRIDSRDPDAGGWAPRAPHSLPAVLRAWLCETGSLTQRVVSICTETRPFSLQLLKRGFAPAHRDELPLLGLHDRARVREILLKRGEAPLVFAHSVISHRDLRGAWAILDGIGGRSLGSILFHDHTVKRGALHFRRIDRRHPLFAKALPWCGDARPSELWARRAVFERRGRPLIVTEVFLPAVMKP
ncbi:MAG: chorismate lyase [Rhodocyclaceae bacterium]|nr:chorismate lyase [Rhodocyclaceae bacterium]